MEDMSTENKGKILSNKPCCEDLFDKKPHDKLASIIAAEIESNKELHIIGLEGEWGSGKSNLLGIIKNILSNTDNTDNPDNADNPDNPDNNKYHFFTYDAWEHQTDLPRRTILEELTIKLKNEGLLRGNIWNEKLQSLLAKKRRTNKMIVPTIGSGVIASVCSVLLFPVLFHLSLLTDCELKRFSILIIPDILIFALAFWRTYRITKKQTDGFKDGSGRFKCISNFFLIYEDQIKEDTTYETISEKEPTSNEFKKWFSDIDKEIKDKNIILIIVIDNMDRLPKEKVRELWATILTFFAEKRYSNIRIIVPFDRKHLRSAFQEENITNCNNKGIKYADDFIDKTFSVVYCVPPPIMTGWMQYFIDKWKDAFGKDTAPNNSVLQIYDILTKERTPRTIISFINQFVTIKNNCDLSIEDKYIALYIIGRNEIMKDPLNEILKPTYLGGLNFLYENDEKMPECISSLHFQLPVQDAMDIIYTLEITRELNENKVKLLKSLKEKSQYWMILYHSISNVANIENATMALHESLKDDKSQNSLNLWNALYKRKFVCNCNDTKYKEYHYVLMSRIKEKSDYYKYLVENYNSNIKDDFDVINYINGVDRLQEILDDENDDFISQFNTNITAENYFTLIVERHERCSKYGLTVEQNKFDDYLSNLPDKTIAETIIYPYTKDILKTPKYITKVKGLLKSKYQNIGIIELLIDRLKEIEERPFNIISYWNFTVLNYLVRNVKEGSKLFPEILAITITVWDNPGNANIRTILNHHFYSEDKKLVKDVAKVIEYYMNYEDLLLSLPRHKDKKLIVAVAEELTTHKYGESIIDVKKVLSKYNDIVKVLKPGDLLNKISDGNDAIEKINSKDIEKFPVALFVDLQKVNNNLSSRCIGLANDYLQNISQEEWREILSSNRNCFSFDLFKKYHPVQLQLCFDAFKELMIGYAKGESNVQMPEKNVDDLIEICKDVDWKFNTIFMEIRDLFINNLSITKDKLRYLGNWLMKYGELWEKESSLEKIFQTQYLDDDFIVRLLIKNGITTKKIFDASSNSDDFRKKMAALLGTKYKANDDFKKLCKNLRIN